MKKMRGCDEAMNASCGQVLARWRERQPECGAETLT